MKDIYDLLFYASLAIGTAGVVYNYKIQTYKNILKNEFGLDRGKDGIKLSRFIKIVDYIKGKKDSLNSRISRDKEEILEKMVASEIKKNQKNKKKLVLGNSVIRQYLTGDY